MSGLGRALFTERSPTSAYRVRQPHHPSFIRVILTAGSGSWQQQEKADKGAEIQGDVGERKEMGCLFLSPTLQVCVYLKKTNKQTKTSFNWVVLVFKINQGGGWWWGWCARRPGSLAGSPAVAFWGHQANRLRSGPLSRALLFPSVSLGGPGRQLMLHW